MYKKIEMIKFCGSEKLNDETEKIYLGASKKFNFMTGR